MSKAIGMLLGKASFYLFLAHRHLETLAYEALDQKKDWSRYDPWVPLWYIEECDRAMVRPKERL